MKKKLNLSHAGLKSPDQNPDPEGAGLKPGPHPEKPGFNPGPGLHFSHPVRSRATPKPGPDPDFAKPTADTKATRIMKIAKCAIR